MADDREEDMVNEGEEEMPQHVMELAEANVPTNTKGIRACKRCGLLKTVDQFINEGCENCQILEMQDNPDRVSTCTTAFFEGTAAIMDPASSWAAKWIRVDSNLPGVYAISVTGTFDQETEDMLTNSGYRWRCRPATS